MNTFENFISFLSKIIQCAHVDKLQAFSKSLSHKKIEFVRLGH